MVFYCILKTDIKSIIYGILIVKIIYSVKLSLLLGSALIQWDLHSSMITSESSAIQKSSYGGLNSVLRESFEEDFNRFKETDFTFVSRLKGGTNSTFTIADSSGEQWVVKFWREKNRGINESLSRYLIDGLSGVNSLSSGYFVGESLPDSVINCLPESERASIGEGVFFSIVPFIRGREGVPSQSQLENLFILTCFFSYFDAKDHNTIIDNQGIVHIIDTGSSLLYRGMGLRKEISENWHPYYISEFKSMFYFENIYTSAGIKSLHDISDNIKTSQLKAILDKGQMILEKVDAFLRKTNSSDRIATLEMISNRLYQMEIFYNHLTSQWSRTSRKYVQASNLDAAGFLSVAEHKGNKLILLGKRTTSNGTNTWCSLGGMANIGEFLHETAAREVFEESSGIINVKSAASMPSHDLVSEKAPGIYHRYRSYFHETAWFDPSTIQNNEYSDYAWVPIKDVLNPNDEIVNKYKLFEPFKNSLMQPEVRSWLESYINQQPIDERHTQGMITKYPLNVAKTRYDFSNPSEHIAECAHEFMKSKAEKDNNRSQNVLLGKSISEIFLMQLAKEHGIVDIDNIPISNLLDKLYMIRNTNCRAESIVFSRIKNAVIMSIEEEKKHLNHYVMYHGVRSSIWLMYRVLSHIRYRLNNDPILETKVLRSLERFFDVLISAQDVRDAMISGLIQNDEHADALSTTISCNPTLFSNFGIHEEETLWFFSSNKNFKEPRNLNEIVNSLFLELGVYVDKNVFEKLQHINDSINGSGAMLQFFVPKEAHHLFYLSEAFGKPAKSRDNKVITDNKEVMDKLLNYDKNYFDSWLPINQVQTRLHLNIAHIDGIKINDYFANSNISLEYIDRQIADAIDPLLESLGRHSITNTSAYREPILLQKISRELLELSSNDMAQEMSQSERAVLSNDLVALKAYFINNRGLIKDFTVIDPGYMRKMIISKEQLETLILIDDTYLDARHRKSTLMNSLSMFERNLNWYNYAKKKMPSSPERDNFIVNFVFNPLFMSTLKPGKMEILTDFYSAGKIGRLLQDSTFIADFTNIPEQTIKKVIEICIDHKLNIKEKMAVLGAAKSGVNINNNILIEAIKNIANISDRFDYSKSVLNAPFIKKIIDKHGDKKFNDLCDDLRSNADVIDLIPAYAICSTTDRARALLKYFLSEQNRHRFYSWELYYNMSLEDISNNIDKIDEKYVPYFNPYEQNIRTFKEYCEFIENVKDGLPAELVVGLAHELTLMKGVNEELLAELTRECLLKGFDDNHALLLSMLEEKRALESFSTPELVLKAYKNDLTLEQFKLASLICEKYWNFSVDDVLNGCKNIGVTPENEAAIHDGMNRISGSEKKNPKLFFEQLISMARIPCP